jgi:hypothetical protein
MGRESMVRGVRRRGRFAAMHNSPYRFLDSPASLRGLHYALEEVGLSGQETAEHETADQELIEPDPYHPACMRFACPWLSEPVELHWHYHWWPDGTQSELRQVSVVCDGVIRGEVNVEELLRQKLARPLAEVLIKRIVAVCGEVTGKGKQA